MAASSYGVTTLLSSLRLTSPEEGTIRSPLEWPVMKRGHPKERVHSERYVPGTFCPPARFRPIECRPDTVDRISALLHAAGTIRSPLLKNQRRLKRSSYSPWSCSCMALSCPRPSAASDSPALPGRSRNPSWSWIRPIHNPSSRPSSRPRETPWGNPFLSALGDQFFGDGHGVLFKFGIAGEVRVNFSASRSLSECTCWSDVTGSNCPPRSGGIRPPCPWIATEVHGGFLETIKSFKTSI
jgi:hypothetical protein